MYLAFLGKETNSDRYCFLLSETAWSTGLVVPFTPWLFASLMAVVVFCWSLPNDNNLLSVEFGAKGLF